MADWLPHDLLLKLDRCLMAHAVEGRTPFLDPGVAPRRSACRTRLKVRERHGQVDPAQMAGEASAGGAAVRAEAGLHRAGRRVDQGRRATRLGPLVAAQPGVAEIADPAQGRARCSATSRRLAPRASPRWKLLFYALWHRRHILGLPPAGDVFETLAAT